MFNSVGPFELIVIGVAALLVFGPKRLPELAKGLGKGIRDFKKALSGEDGGDEEEKKASSGKADGKPETLPPAGTIAQGSTPASTPQGTKVGGSGGEKT